MASGVIDREVARISAYITEQHEREVNLVHLGILGQKVSRAMSKGSSIIVFD